MFDAGAKEVHQLAVGQGAHVHVLKVLQEVFFGVHLQHLVDSLLVKQKPLSVVLGHSRVDLVLHVQKYFLEVGRVVSSVAVTNGHADFTEFSEVNFEGEFLEHYPDEFVVSGLQQPLGVLISQLHESQFADNLAVDHSQLVVHRLVEHHMVDSLVNALACRPDSLESIEVDSIEQQVELLGLSHVLEVSHLGAESPDELDDEGVVEVDAEVETVEQHEWVVVDVVGELTQQLNYLDV
jgi:hypothetical protein